MTPRRGRAGGLRAFQRLTRATRSALRRYPAELWGSLGDARRNGRGPGPTHGHGHAHRHETPDLAAHHWAAVWLGHASTLLRIGGKTIITDPVLSERIGPRLGKVTVGLRRRIPSPLRVEHLPAIDVILLSHAHFDHLDKPTLRALASSRTVVITAGRTTRLVPRGFAQVIELGWDETYKLGGLEVSALRPAHWGARTAVDRRRGYNSYVLRTAAAAAEGRPAFGALFAGDTAYTDAFNGLRGIDLAIMGIGAYEPWEHAHATPEQAWTMFRGCGARHLLPIHHSTFALGDEPMGEPMDRLVRAAGDHAACILRAKVGELWTAERAR